MGLSQSVTKLEATLNALYQYKHQILLSANSPQTTRRFDIEFKLGVVPSEQLPNIESVVWVVTIRDWLNNLATVSYDEQLLTACQDVMNRLGMS